MNKLKRNEIVKIKGNSAFAEVIGGLKEEKVEEEKDEEEKE